MKKDFDLYEIVTDKIVAALENGVVPWQKPWVSGYTMPINATTKRPYNGLNVFLLYIEQMAKGYEVPAWLTFKQAKALGANVRKGEKATMVVFWKVGTKEVVDPDTGEKKDKKTFLLRYYNVFNVAQVENLPEEFLNKFKAVNPNGKNNKLHDEFVNFVKATQAVIINGKDRACFVPSLDVIWMPALESFNTAGDYMITNLHELGHWTGAEKRLNREFGKRFGDNAYAFEELVAEMTAAFLGAHLNVQGKVEDNSVSYIGHWLEIMKADKKAIFTAASQATKAANYLRKFSEGEVEEGANDEENA